MINLPEFIFNDKDLLDLFDEGNNLFDLLFDRSLPRNTLSSSILTTIVWTLPLDCFSTGMSKS